MGHIYAPPVEFLIPLRPALSSRRFSYDIQARKLLFSLLYLCLFFFSISHDRFGVNNWRLLAFYLFVIILWFLWGSWMDILPLVLSWLRFDKHTPYNDTNSSLAMVLASPKARKKKKKKETLEKEGTM